MWDNLPIEYLRLGNWAKHSLFRQCLVLFKLLLVQCCPLNILDKSLRPKNRGFLPVVYERVHILLLQGGHTQFQNKKSEFYQSFFRVF
jgi:hypothetical protein